MATMRKLVMKGPKESEIITVERPVINKPTEVLVKLHYCGVCMSEHYDWTTAPAGRTFGHEPMGTVVEVGEGVTRVKVGDRVSMGAGGGAEYQKLDEKWVHKIPDNVEDHQGIIEPLWCLVSAVSKVRLPIQSEKVAVVGCGYMGCGAISLLAMRGVKVVAVDINPESLKNALKYGACEAYLPEELPEEYITTRNTYKGVDVDSAVKNAASTGFPLVMEWGETAESLDLAIRMTRQCGQLAIGAYHTGGKRLVDVQLLNVRAIDCLSTHPREQDLNFRSAECAMRMLGDDTWSYKHVPTKVYPASMFDKAHEELEIKFGKWMKAVIDWENEDFEPYIIND